MRAAYHKLSLVVIPALLFLPMLGRGFIHDDFMWIYSATFKQPDDLLKVFTSTRAMLFYEPVTILSFWLSGHLWRGVAFGYGLENLLLHMANGLLLYNLTLALTRRALLAFLTALFFTINHTTNLWGVMWISTRAHLLCTFFSLCMGVMLIRWYRADNNRLWLAIGVVTLFGLALFSKEWGIMMLPWSALLIVCENRAGGPGTKRASLWALGAGLLAITALYWILRSHTTALSPFDQHHGYRMQINIIGPLNNLLRFTLRGLLIPGLIACAMMALLPGSARSRLAAGVGATGRQPVFWFGLLWFFITILPFVALPMRSGIYNYMPNIGLALSLATLCKNVWQATPDLDWARYRKRLIALALMLIVAGIPFAYARNWKWMRWAQLSGKVLAAVKRQHPTMSHGALVYLRDDPGEKYRLRDAFGQWEGLTYALKVTYQDDSLRGRILASDIPTVEPRTAPVYCFQFLGMDAPDVLTDVTGHFNRVDREQP